MFKNRRHSHAATRKGDHTAHLILGAALDLFRTRGYDQTSMRDIAQAAGLAVGAAYYYFPSKEHLVLAYYDDVQARYARLLPERLAGVRGLARRFEVALDTKLDLVGADRELLRALFRYAADPAHPLAIFSRETARDRAAAIDSFALVLTDTRLPADLAGRAPRLLWLAHLGVLFLLLHDGSAEARRVRGLVPAIAQITATVLRVAAAPGMGPLRKRTEVLSHEVEKLLEGGDYA
jgi:AcrR family transcriptional regulator